MSTDILTRYKRAEGPLPDSMWLWPLYGAGFENLGREGKGAPLRLRAATPRVLYVDEENCWFAMTAWGTAFPTSK